MNLTRAHYILIIILGVLILLLFGHSSKPSKPKARKPHTVTEKIIDFATKHDKSKNNPNGLNMGSDTSADRGNNKTIPNSLYNPSQHSNSHSLTTPGSNGMQNPYLSNSGNMMPSGQQNPAPQQAAPVARPDEYYPPPPQTGGAVKPAPQQPAGVPHSSLQDHQYHQLLKTGPGLTTSNGTFVTFEGTTAYTMNADGVPEAMKDGRYLIGTNHIMVIRGGIKVAN